MATLPIDPLNVGSNIFNTGNYIYAYAYVFTTPVHTYNLFTALENLKDPERCEIKKYKYYNNASDFCVSIFPWRSQIYNISPNVVNGTN